MPTRKSSPTDPAGSEEPGLKRERAGRYTTADGRFTVEQESGAWLVVDAEQADELGLPIVRGPFSSLEKARTAISEIRGQPAPTSPLEGRLREAPTGGRKPAEKREGSRESRGRRGTEEAAQTPPPPPPPIEVRRLEPGDEAVLKQLPGIEADLVPGSLIRRNRPVETTKARRFLERGEVILVVAFQADEPRGFALAYALASPYDEPPMLLIRDVGIAAGGAPEDLGRRLFDALWAVAREREIRRAVVLTSETDDGAIALYSQLGGKRDTTSDVVFHFDIPRH